MTDAQLVIAAILIAQRRGTLPALAEKIAADKRELAAFRRARDKALDKIVERA